MTTSGGTLVITYTGVVSGDTFTGTADMGFAKVPYTGVRIKHSGQVGLTREDRRLSLVLLGTEASMFVVRRGV